MLASLESHAGPGSPSSEFVAFIEKDLDLKAEDEVGFHHRVGREVYVSIANSHQAFMEVKTGGTTEFKL